MIYKTKTSAIILILFGVLFGVYLFIEAINLFEYIMSFIGVFFCASILFLAMTSYIKINDRGIFKINKLFKTVNKLDWDNIKSISYDEKIIGKTISFVVSDKEREGKFRFNIIDGDFIVSFQSNMDELIYEIAQYIPENTKTNLEFKMKVKEIEYERNKK